MTDVKVTNEWIEAEIAHFDDQAKEAASTWHRQMCESRAKCYRELLSLRQADEGAVTVEVQTIARHWEITPPVVELSVSGHDLLHVCIGDSVTIRAR